MKSMLRKYYKLFLAYYFLAGAFAAWYWTYWQAAQQELFSHLSSTYSQSDIVQMKRGPYAGCSGQIISSQELHYVVYFFECKGDRRFHGLIEADQFDDKALSFMEKF